MKKLIDLDPAEVSLVTRGANKRKFLIWKDETGAPEEEDMPENIPDHANPDIPVQDPQQIAEDHGAPPVPLSARAMAAVQAVVRILTPFKGEITDSDLDQAMSDSGVINQEDNTVAAPVNPKAAPKDPKQMPGKNPAPPQVAAQKDDMDGGDVEMSADEDDDADDMDQDMMDQMKACKSDDEILKVAKSFLNKSQGGQSVDKKSVMKSDGTIDMTAVPEAVRPAVEAIYKSQQELVAKNADLETQLKTERHERREKEFIAKAESFVHYTGDRKELATQLMALEDSSKPLYESFVKNLEGLESEKAMIHKSATQEIGSGMSAGSTDASAKIDAAVAAIVTKSAGGLSKEQAYSQFITSDEGQKLYSEYKSNRKGGI